MKFSEIFALLFVVYLTLVAFLCSIGLFRQNGGDATVDINLEEPHIYGTCEEVGSLYQSSTLLH